MILRSNLVYFCPILGIYHIQYLFLVTDLQIFHFWHDNFYYFFLDFCIFTIIFVIKLLFELQSRDQIKTINYQPCSKTFRDVLKN